MCVFGNYWLYLSILSLGFSTQSQGIDFSCDETQQWFLHRNPLYAHMVCACTPRYKQRYGRLFGFCWIARNVPFPKSHITSFCCFGNIITFLYYKQSKQTQMHSSLKVCVWPEELFGMERGSALLILLVRPAVVLHGCPQEGQPARIRKEGKDWDWGGPCKWAIVTFTSRELGQGQACRQQCCQLLWLSGLGTLVCYCHRQLTGQTSSWEQPVCWERCNKLPSHHSWVRLSWSLSPAQGNLCYCKAALAGVCMAKW